MPPIAQIGTKVRVTPGDEIAVVRGPNDCEYVNDRSPFSLVVEGTIESSGRLIGVYGQVISGHDRYLGLTANLLIRVDNCDWRRDNRSGANFKVGCSVIRLNGRYPLYHPDGTEIDGFPFVMRYGSLDSRSENEVTVNSAVDFVREPEAEQGAPPNPAQHFPLHEGRRLESSSCAPSAPSGRVGALGRLA